MKKSILLIALSGILFTAKAQTFNIQAGTSVSHLNWAFAGFDNHIYDQNIIGYSFFVGVDYLDFKYLNLSSNVGIIRKGGMMEFEFLDIEGQSIGIRNDRATLDYVSVNTLVDLKYPLNDKLIPFICVGPRVDFLAKSNERFNDFKEQGLLNSVSYGILAGGGIKFVIAKSLIGFRFDYYADMNDIVTYQAFNQTEPVEIKAKTFSLNLSYGYRF